MRRPVEPSVNLFGIVSPCGLASFYGRMPCLPVFQPGIVGVSIAALVQTIVPGFQPISRKSPDYSPTPHLQDRKRQLEHVVKLLEGELRGK